MPPGPLCCWAAGVLQRQQPKEVGVLAPVLPPPPAMGHGTHFGTAAQALGCSLFLSFRVLHDSIEARRPRNLAPLAAMGRRASPLSSRAAAVLVILLLSGAWEGCTWREPPASACLDGAAARLLAGWAGPHTDPPLERMGAVEGVEPAAAVVGLPAARPGRRCRCRCWREHAWQACAA